MQIEPLMEHLETGTIDWELGPFHPALPGVFSLRLEVDGEMVVSAKTDHGYLHRGIEQAMEKFQWDVASVYASRLDPENSVFGELSYSLAVESIEKTDVPKRATQVRLVLSEMARISSHLLYLVRMARSVGSETVVHYLLRDRETFLDLFELISGSRFNLNFIRLGGIAQDVTDGFIERAIDICDLIKTRIPEYQSMLTSNQIFNSRTRHVGVLDQETVRRFGITGPNARASGVGHDIRRDTRFSFGLPYQKIHFENASRTNGNPDLEVLGDSFERTQIRFDEIHQSIEMVRQICESIAPGPFRQEFNPPPAGEGVSILETPRGSLLCHVFSNGGPCPDRVHFSSVSTRLLATVPDLLRGVRLADVPVILTSLDLSMSEVDR